MSFSNAITVNRNVVLALASREMLIRQREPLETILAILEPLAVISVVTFVIWFMSRAPIYGTSTMLFVATGLFPHYLFIQIARKMRVGTARRRFPVESVLNHVCVNAVYRVADYAIMGVILFTLIYVFSTEQALPHDYWTITKGCTALICLGFGVAMVNIAMIAVFPLWSYIFPGSRPEHAGLFRLPAYPGHDAALCNATCRASIPSSTPCFCSGSGFTRNFLTRRWMSDI